MMSDEGWRADLHHDLAAGKLRSKRGKPYDTSRWKQRRTELKHDAGCVLCARFKIFVRATAADHLIPTANSKEDFYEATLQPLCCDCHKIKLVVEHAWRRGELDIAELNFATGKEALRRRAAAFGVGVDGFQLINVDR